MAWRDFPGTPVLVTPQERRFVEEGGAVTVVARSARAARYEEYAFEGGPYLGFARSHDVHGEGPSSSCLRRATRPAR